MRRLEESSPRPPGPAVLRPAPELEACLDPLSSDRLIPCPIPRTVRGFGSPFASSRRRYQGRGLLVTATIVAKRWNGGSHSCSASSPNGRRPPDAISNLARDVCNARSRRPRNNRLYRSPSDHRKQPQSCLHFVPCLLRRISVGIAMARLKD